jgi:hypothetical protein
MQREGDSALFNKMISDTQMTKRERTKLTTAFGKATKANANLVGFNSLATSIIAKTLFFRRYQIALSEQCATSILDWFKRNPNCVKTSAQVGRVRFIQAVQANRHRLANLQQGASRPEGEDEQQAQTGLITTRAMKKPAQEPTKKAQKRTNQTIRKKTTTTKSSPAVVAPAAAALNADDTEQLENDNLEIDFIVDGAWEKGIAWFLVKWVGWDNNKDNNTWMKYENLSSAREAVQNYLSKKPMRGKAPTQAQLAEDGDVDGRYAIAKEIMKNDTTHAELMQIQKDEIFDAAFQDAGEASKGRVYQYAILYNTPPKKGQMPTLMQTVQTSGQFTDKVKAIRDFIREHSKDIVGEDPSWYDQYNYRARPFTQLRFGQEEGLPSSFRDKPWFSFPTAAAGPNTTMLHTTACRNLSDPRDRTQTRTFNEMDVMFWDFDKIAEAGIMINTKFRFCKECKRYSNVINLRRSINPEVNKLLDDSVQQEGRQERQQEPSLPQPLSAPTPLPKSNKQIPAWSNSSRSTSSSSVSLSHLPPQRLPLTNIVSYLAVRKAHFRQTS